MNVYIYIQHYNVHPSSKPWYMCVCVKWETQIQAVVVVV